MDKLKKVLSGQDGNNDDGDIFQAANQASTLGWGNRMKGFIACFVLGVLFSILGTCFLWIPRVGLILFAVLYTLGNIASLCSTMFLMGPLNQLKKMCAKERALATAVMLVWPFLHSICEGRRYQGILYLSEVRLQSFHVSHQLSSCDACMRVCAFGSARALHSLAHTDHTGVLGCCPMTKHS
uniref:Vesicle transport protein n=1 Tax=Esox lucius TaxID=8010 RepID=A0A3P8XBA1_ESOLU